MANAILIGLGAIALLVLLDRVGLWAERRGWIYWRRSKRRGTAAGNALLDLETFMNPAARHVIEAREETIVNETNAGDPPIGKKPEH